jgi:hypothetical protein
MGTRRKKDEYPAFKTVRDFQALSREEKDKVWRYYDREKIPMSESRPLNTNERAQFERVRRRVGRPKVGQGAKVVAVTMEKGFLSRVDAYAKKHALKRAEMITRGLRLVMGEAC